MSAALAIGGRHNSGVRLTIDDEIPSTAPRVYVAETGFTHLDSGERGLWDAGDLRAIKSLAAAMRATEGGLYIAFFERPDGPHPLVLVQDDRSTFAERHHGSWTATKPAWRDFYFAAGHVAIDFADWLWKPGAIGVRNLSGGPTLPPDALTAFLEGVGFQLDRRELDLRQIDFSGHDDLRDEVNSAVGILGQEQTRQFSPALRPLHVDTAGFHELGLRGNTLGVRLLRIAIGAQQPGP